METKANNAYKEALKYAEPCLVASLESKDQYLISNAYQRLAEVHLGLGNLDLALKNSEECGKFLPSIIEKEKGNFHLIRAKHSLTCASILLAIAKKKDKKD